MSLFHASTCFEHNVLIVRRPKLYFKDSSNITHIGGHPEHYIHSPITHTKSSLQFTLYPISNIPHKHFSTIHIIYPLQYPTQTPLNNSHYIHSPITQTNTSLQFKLHPLKYIPNKHFSTIHIISTLQ